MPAADQCLIKKMRDGWIVLIDDDPPSLHGSFKDLMAVLEAMLAPEHVFAKKEFLYNQRGSRAHERNS